MNASIPVSEDQLVSCVTDFYLESARGGSFNGISALAALIQVGANTGFREVLANAVSSRKVECVFQCRDMNPHIKRLPMLPVEKQLELLARETSTLFACIQLLSI